LKRDNAILSKELKMNVKIQTFIAFFIGVYCFTFFRSTLVLTSPIVYFLLIIFFNKSINRYVLSISLLVISISIIPIIYFDFKFINYLVSIFFILPSLILLLSPVKVKHINIDKFMKILSSLLLIVNFSALVQFLNTAILKSGNVDDSFIGIYGTSGLIMHTLSLVNFIFFGYYYFVRNSSRSKSIIFLISGTLCFYGLGFVIFIASFVFTSLKKKSIKLTHFLVAPILIVVIYGVINILNPTVINYTFENLRMIKTGWQSFDYNNEMSSIKNFERSEFPRKLTMFIGSANRLKLNPEIILLGTGPGTYNSRTSFLLNGKYSSIKILKDNVKSTPKFATEDIYPLWNRNILFQYNDGTRNEPFSSLIAFPMEYGFPMAALVFIAIFLKLKFLYKKSKNKEFLMFLFLILGLNLLFENYLEYAEAMIIIIVIFKLEESRDRE